MSEPATCTVVGGGPAGMILGLLLARAGVHVTVLEKHGDFLRDFRGDTVHPSTLRLLDDLGLFEKFDALPQGRILNVTLPAAHGGSVIVADFRKLDLPHPYVAMVPQWDLLNLLAEAGRSEPTFTLRMNTEAVGLVRENGKVVGIRYRDADGEGELRSDLTVACDGRWSLMRSEAGLTPRDYPVNMDVFWFRLPSADRVGESLLPKLKDGKAFLLIPREGYIQTARLVPKGDGAKLRERGIEAFRRDLVEVAPDLESAAEGIASMDDVKLLDVKINRLSRWHVDGLLCIGDAAHAMSPMGGVGINLAVQDAVAAATLLAEPLLSGRLTSGDLDAVRRRRIVAAVLIQTLQRGMHAVFDRAFARKASLQLPSGARVAFTRIPFLNKLTAYLVGVGPRPERAPDFARRRTSA